MRKFTIIILATLISLPVKSANLSVYYYYSPFYNSEVGTYLETYITVIGKSAVFKKNENGKFQAIVEITMLFNQESKVKEFRKYNLKSPEIDDTASFPNFIDLQRINLKEGLYNFELKIKDLQADNAKEYVFNDIITMAHKNNEIEISGIEYLEKYSLTEKVNALSRNGYDMVPYVADYYPSNIKNFSFYFEIYNTKAICGENQEFLLQYYIEPTSTNKPHPNFTKTKKQIAKDIIPVLGDFTIEGLETGNYNFVVEIRNKENKTLATKKSFFQRSNPKEKINWEEMDKVVIEHTFVENITTVDSIKEFINELYPVSDAAEVNYANNVKNSNEISKMQKYFYSFWYSRNNSNPESEWNKYKEQVEYVNKLFGSQVKKGYESDRGRVYLQYGAPNSVSSGIYDGNTYPYEIWHYYVMGNQRDRLFLFYNRELVGKDFRLIYSNAKGEVYLSTLDMIVKNLYRGDTVLPDTEWSNKIKEDLRKEGFRY